MSMVSLSLSLSFFEVTTFFDDKNYFVRQLFFDNKLCDVKDLLTSKLCLTPKTSPTSKNVLDITKDVKNCVHVKNMFFWQNKKYKFLGFGRGAAGAAGTCAAITSLSCVILMFLFKKPLKTTLADDRTFFQ